MSVVHQYNGDPLKFFQYFKSLCDELATVNVKTPVGGTTKLQESSILHVLLMAKCHHKPQLMGTSASFEDNQAAWREANASSLTEVEWELYDKSVKQGVLNLRCLESSN